MIRRVWRSAAIIAAMTGAATCQTTSPSGVDFEREAGSALIRSFTPKVYRASPQNWAAVQDGRGVLYFANTDCVLEYDGVSWRRIPIGNNAVARSLAVSSAGRVYVGAQGDFGYLEGAAGATKFQSLTGLLPKDAGKFSDVWSVIPAVGAVYFGAYQAIFRWTPGSKSIRIWKPATRFGRLAQVASELYVTSEGQGLLHLRGDDFEPLAGGETLRPADIRTFIRNGASVGVVARKGLLALENGTLTPVTHDFEKMLGEGSIYSAVRLRGGMAGLATTLSGVLFLRPDGSVAHSMAKENGLLTNAATSLFEDREGGLWITSGAGLDRADLAMTRFAQGEGLVGATYVVIRSAGRLYAGTDQGLFVLQSGAGSIAAFQRVKGISEAIFAAVNTRHGLVIGGQRGIYSVGGTESQSIHATALVYDAAVSPRDEELLYTVSREGLQSFRWKRSAWVQERTYPSGGEDFRSVLEDADGRIWVTTQKDILRVDWRNKEGLVERFGTTAGVPPGFKNVYRVRGGIVFATPKGLMTFDAVLSRFLPWNELGREFGDGGKPVSIVREVSDGRVWITGEGYHGELRPGRKGPEWQAMPLGRADMAELYAVLPEEDGTVWAAGTDGFLVRYSPQQQPPAAPFGVLVRRVQSQGGPTVYDGAGLAGQAPRIPYGENSLRVEFAAPYMQDPGKVRYQWRLDGADASWSDWSLETQKDYTHLLEGNYKFLVRAMNPAGVTSLEAPFAFAIAPPWFRTWGAYIFYLMAMGGSVWGLLKWRTGQLVADKAKLEQTVEERTVEIRQQRDQIQLEEKKSQTLLLNILPASVADELKRTGTVQPQHYDDVTVCFTDFAGFTLSSEALPAGNLVSALNEYFTVFDGIVEEFGLEKLKTIGDAYMLVSGLPRPRRGHAVDAVLAALRMVEAVEDLARLGEGPAWEVRVGLHSGAVAAGVVGVRKFAFDIWGNTVNLASRMESSGAVRRVNLSEDTWEAVRDFVECEARGAVKTKDKRDLRMYFAMGLRPELCEPAAFAAAYREKFGEDPGYSLDGIPKMVTKW